MAKIFITGSSDGLGKLAAEKLIQSGHTVFLHARNTEKKEVLSGQITEAADILVGDLAKMEEVKSLADQVNVHGKMDAIIHNAGVYSADSATLFQVNVLAPYSLTALMELPKRLIYLSSGMHLGGRPIYRKEDLPSINYSDTKLMVSTLAAALAKRYPNTLSNSVDPGWVPTKMGGKNATDDLQKGMETQVWLAESQEKEAMISGHYFFHKRIKPCHEAVNDPIYQERLLGLCESVTGIKFK